MDFDLNTMLFAGNELWRIAALFAVVAIALVAGWARGTPAISKPPVATDALMKSRLVSFIQESP